MKTPLLVIAIAGSALMASSLSALPGGPPPRPDPETVVVEMFAGFDADENNALSQDELAAALAGIHEKRQAERQGDRPCLGCQGPQGEPPADRPLKPRAGKRRGPPSPTDIAPRLIEDFDANSDGELNTEELLRALEQMHERGRRGPPPPPPAGDAA